MITLVAAVATNGVIGNAGGLPWSIPGDLKRFRQLTIGKPVIMGRATYDSIGRPLDERTNIVLTRNSLFDAPGVHRACDPKEAMTAARRLHGADAEICVIGGAEVYRIFLPMADRLELTMVALAPQGDAFFPEWDQTSWNRVSATEHAGPPRYEFTTWERAVPAASQES
jgi:dihydrofolate reductase